MDNDPHVIINLPTSNLTVCFNIDDKEGTIFSLVSDELSGQSEVQLDGEEGAHLSLICPLWV